MIRKLSYSWPISRKQFCAINSNSNLCLVSWLFFHELIFEMSLVILVFFPALYRENFPIAFITITNATIHLRDIVFIKSRKWRRICCTAAWFITCKRRPCSIGRRVKLKIIGHFTNNSNNVLISCISSLCCTKETHIPYFF